MSNSSAIAFVSKLLIILIKLFLAVLALILVLVLAVPIGFYGMAMYIEPSLPSVTEIQTAQLSMPLEIYSHDGKLIGKFGNDMSLPIAFEDMPKQMIQAFMAAEDDSFMQHSGISVKGLGRAVTEIFTDDDSQTGGSTITMQVAKNYFLSSERTFTRKLTELFLSRKLEQELSKKEILTLYVNKIYLGEGAYGIQAAARRYYDKSLDELSIAQTAMIAGLPKAPSRYNPVANPERALIRRNWIIGRMLTLGYINKAQHDAAIQEPIALNMYELPLDGDMPYLAEMARFALVSKYGNQVMNSGWKVRLTVDSNIQKDADNAIRKSLLAYDKAHGYRGSEGNVADKPLSKYNVVGGMYPAEVVKINYRNFDAKLINGEIINVPWSGMSWAQKYLNANQKGRYPNRATDLVKMGDIVRVIPSFKNNNKQNTPANDVKDHGVKENDDAERTETDLMNGNNTSTNMKSDLTHATWRLAQVPKVQGSLVSINPDNGALIALVGGFDYYGSKFNRATSAWRQPGSTIKPLVYSAALEKGYHPDSMIADSPLRVGDWQPKNSDGRYYGMMPLRKALYLSRNLVSIRLLQSVGTPTALNLLDQFGLDKEKLPATLSLALGAGETSPLQMTTAYATFANGGHRIQPYFIEQIYSFDNQLIYQANPKQACAICYNKNLEKINQQRAKVLQSTVTENHDKNNQADAKHITKIDAFNKVHFIEPLLNRAEQAPRILSPRASYEMADILRDVVQRGTATKAKSLGRSDIAGKTGTTNNFKDAWFAGFHPTMTTVVWIGFDQPTTLGNRAYGGVLALPVWIEFMGKQLKDTPNKWVSLNNQAKSREHKQESMELTDKPLDGVAEETMNDTDESKLPMAKEELRSSPPPDVKGIDNFADLNLDGIDNFDNLNNPNNPNNRDHLNEPPSDKKSDKTPNKESDKQTITTITSKIHHTAINPTQINPTQPTQ